MSSNTNTLAVSMDILPNEVLDRIIAQVKLGPSSFTHLRTCLFVSHRWKETTLPHLYRYIILTSSNTSRFLAFFNLKYNQLIKSLTIRITQLESPPDGYNIENKLLQRIITVLPHLTNLSTFSLTITTTHRERFVVSLSTVASAIDALPFCVESLELDTGLLDTSALNIDPQIVKDSGPSHNVICDALRTILPRLVNFRVHIASMCSHMFGTGELSDFAPISLPKMKRMMINCITVDEGSFQSSKIIGEDYRAGDVDIDHPDSTWNDVTEALMLLVQKEGSHLPDAKFLILGAINPEPDNREDVGPAYSTIIRADVVAQVSWALPVCVVPGPDSIDGRQDPWFLRTSDGKEFIGSTNALRVVAEGLERWRDDEDGCRLPAGLLLGKEQYDLSYNEVVSVKTSDEWRDENKGCPLYLWEKERKTGVKLINAEKREGNTEFLSKLPLVEKTPTGWERRSNSLGIFRKTIS
jgi:hypothetical protein